MMKTLLDWEPYKPFTVGFDTIMDRLLEIDTAIPNYPPYNIRKTDELEYVIDLAVAGFGKDDIDVKYGAFKRTFALADDLVVNNATLENGLLSIEIEKIVPEAKKPKTIAIK
jgi:molecular chaperone IbpA